MTRMMAVRVMMIMTILPMDRDRIIRMMLIMTMIMMLLI